MGVKQFTCALSIVLFCSGMAIGQTVWDQHPDNPVIGPGSPGEWDEVGRFICGAFFDGSTYHIWFTGSKIWAGATITGGIGHGTSSDGVEWAMDPANPVLTRGAPGEWDDFFLAGGALIHDGTQFQMWYTGWHDPFSATRAGYATSPDGSVWTKYPNNPVMDVGPPGSWDESYVYPFTVIVDGETYRMWYTGWSSLVGGAAIGYAESSDGIHWTKRPDQVLGPGEYPRAWDRKSVGSPSVIFDGTTYHMWYGGGGEPYPWGVNIGYAFSSNGIEWTKHRDNPVVQSDDRLAYQSSVILDGSIWHMWYSHWDEGIFRISYATSDCCAGTAGLTHTRFIPAAALASGAAGAYFQTDIDVNNADNESTQYQFMWLPRGEDNSEPTVSEIFSLGAGMSVRYNNVLSEVFGLEPNSLGALGVLATSADLLMMSRTYNTPSGKTGGTYGQAIPAVPLGDFMQSGEQRRILFGSENADLRTNVGCQNGSYETAMVTLDLFDTDGISLAREMMILGPWGNDQINRIFGDFQPITGYVEVGILNPGNQVHCYGSVLDNVTNDPTTIPPQ